jgi:hypothetical protein
MLTVIADHWTPLIFHVVISAPIRSTHVKNHMTMDENFNTMHACIVCSTDDDNDNAHHSTMPAMQTTSLTPPLSLSPSHCLTL